MGTTPIMGITSAGNCATVAVSSNDGPNSGGSGCSDKSLTWWVNWKLKPRNYRNLFSPTLLFFLSASVLLGLVATIYAWLFFTPFVHTPYIRTGLSSLGCQDDNEGSWSIGVFYGDSPFSLKPIEHKNVWREKNSAWPIANPVVTCASASAAGFPSNFVADPFLYIKDDILYLFYETKNTVTMQGDIGVAKSTDNGATWQHLGIALDEEWHLSYPYIFNYLGQIYMMPEGSERGELRLYKAVNFPVQWKLERVMMKRPIVDAVMFKYNDKYWLFGSDHKTSFGARKNGQLEIWYSKSPLSPWTPHKKNPIYNLHKSFGARNGGRPFTHSGSLYRIGQDCGETYGRKIRTFKVETLTENEYNEVEVSSGFEESKKGRNAWNGVRHHHLDAQQLVSGKWIGVMDGDRVPSGDSWHNVIIGYASILSVFVLVVLLGILLGTIKFLVPLNWCANSSGKRSDALFAREKQNPFSYKVLRICNRLNRLPTSLRVWIKPKTWVCRAILTMTYISIIVLFCNGVQHIYGGNGAEEPYPVRGYYSQFTLVTMTYDARLWNLKMYINHYSKCSSVKEILVIWNKGTPPDLHEFDSAVPVRIRVEEFNSLNNRFKLDPLINTRAVLELDDDIMMTCGDIERGFKVWRDHPDRIVGFYPRLVDGPPLKYRPEKYARSKKGYNMMLTGAAFLDSKFAFERYWSEEVKEGREIVDKNFNCEDVLLNYLYANASSNTNVEYVKPAWAIDTSKLSGVAISRNTNEHYKVRSECLRMFSSMFGDIGHKKSEFNRRNDGWDI